LTSSLASNNELVLFGTNVLESDSDSYDGYELILFPSIPAVLLMNKIWLNSG
jgi:hypothetical protein